MPDELQFEIIDPPRVPLTPTGPNRLKWGHNGIPACSWGPGAALSILLSLMRPKIYDKQSNQAVNNITGSG